MTEEVVEEKIDLLIKDPTHLTREEIIEKTQAIENEETIDPKILMIEETTDPKISMKEETIDQVKEVINLLSLKKNHSKKVIFQRKKGFRNQSFEIIS